MTSKPIQFSENITVFDLTDSEVGFPMDRKTFYEEQVKAFKETGEPTKACEIVDVMLFTKEKELILQKRSHTKRHNPYLIDKTVGGHVVYGDNPFYTVMIETVQELRVPSIVLRSQEDFRRTYKTMESYLENIAILKYVDHNIYPLTKVIDGEEITIANKVHMFMGVYTGATKPVDREASGILYYSLDMLKQEMKATPANFTHDLHFFLETYADTIDQFIKAIG